MARGPVGHRVVIESPNSMMEWDLVAIGDDTVVEAARGAATRHAQARSHASRAGIWIRKSESTNQQMALAP